MRRGNFRGKVTPIPPQTHSEPPLPKLERTVMEKLDQVEKVADSAATRREIKAAVDSLKTSDAVIFQAIQAMERRMDSLSSRIEGVNRGLAAVGSGTSVIRQGLSEVAALKVQISALAESLSALNSELGSRSKTLEKALETASSSKTGAKGLNVMAKAMLEVCNRLDSLPEPAKPADLGPIVEEVRRYIHADKRVLRDREGNISGWKIDA
jgi:chromosome segregation ATPase